MITVPRFLILAILLVAFVVFTIIMVISLRKKREKTALSEWFFGGLFNLVSAALLTLIIGDLLQGCDPEIYARWEAGSYDLPAVSNPNETEYVFYDCIPSVCGEEIELTSEQVKTFPRGVGIWLELENLGISRNRARIEGFSIETRNFTPMINSTYQTPVPSSLKRGHSSDQTLVIANPANLDVSEMAHYAFRHTRAGTRLLLPEPVAILQYRTAEAPQTYNVVFDLMEGDFVFVEPGVKHNQRLYIWLASPGTWEFVVRVKLETAAYKLLGLFYNSPHDLGEIVSPPIRIVYDNNDGITARIWFSDPKDELGNEWAKRVVDKSDSQLGAMVITKDSPLQSSQYVVNLPHLLSDEVPENAILAEISPSAIALSELDNGGYQFLPPVLQPFAFENPDILVPEAFQLPMLPPMETVPGD